MGMPDEDCAAEGMVAPPLDAWTSGEHFKVLIEKVGEQGGDLGRAHDRIEVLQRIIAEKNTEITTLRAENQLQIEAMAVAAREAVEAIQLKNTAYLSIERMGQQNIELRATVRQYEERIASLQKEFDGRKS